MERRITISGAKQIDLVNYLSVLGFEPVKTMRFDHWYLSPLRNEKTASFKVNSKINRWYDFGIGNGGSIIDFGILYYNCTIREFMDHLNGTEALVPSIMHIRIDNPIDDTFKEITITGTGKLANRNLIAYLLQRCIPIDIAQRHCSEITFDLKAKSLYALGFANDLGGYELRNPYLKLSISPKGITTIKNGTDTVAVFEGFFDFLSFLSIQGQDENKSDYLVLNSISFFETARSLLEGYDMVNLFLDRDQAGQNCSKSATELDGRYNDRSCLYEGFKDLNDWLVNKRQGGMGNKAIWLP